MKISIIVPAFNEEKYLPETIEKIVESAKRASCESEIIVVDNDSADKTGEIACRAGATIVSEKEHNIARVRNAGAKAAGGDVFVFIDADTRVPPELLQAICERMADKNCFGGAVAVAYEKFERKWMRFYLLGWRFWSVVFNMKQGAAQFCRRDGFFAVGGYDETVFMGEDVQFYWRLAKLAGQNGGRLEFMETPKVVTSSRRFDKMPVWKILLLTNPLFFLLSTKRKRFWKDWYDKPVR